MRVPREVRTLADVLDERAAAYEAAARSGGDALPHPDLLADAPLQRFGRAMWRDAGTASALREVASALRITELPRVRSWLVARQVECDCAAEEAMARLTSGSGGDRDAEVARSAYLLGRAKGVKVATELCQPQAGAVR